MERKDPLTGEKFISRRRNQRFATSKNRIRYHNDRSNLEREAKAFIDKPFRMNHRILLGLLSPNEKKTFSKEYLSGMGYKSSILSHYEVFEGKTCPALYNFILTSVESNSPNITIYRKK